MAQVSISKRFGLAVRSARQKRGLSQELIAEKAGIHPTYLGMVERGLRNPTLDVADRLATALEMELITLLRKAETNSPQ